MSDAVADCDLEPERFRLVDREAISVVGHRARKARLKEEMAGKALVDSIDPRQVDQRVANLDVWKDQRLGLGVALINGVEAGRSVTCENVRRVDRELSAIRLFRIGLDDLKRIEALDICQILLAKRADRALAQDLEPHRAVDCGRQVRPN